MKNLAPRIVGACALFVVASCSQAPVNVVDKGSQFYGKPDNYQFSSYHSAPATSSEPYQSVSIEPAGIAESAPVEEMSVSSLPEPVRVSEPKPVSVAPTVSVAEPEPVLSVPVKSARVEMKQDMKELASLPAPKIEPVAVSAKMDAPSSEAFEDKITELAPKVNAPKLADAAERNSNFIWPVEGKIVSRFGPKSNGLINDGINIAAADGEPIWSAARGEVVYAGNELKGYGNMVIIRHDNGWMTAYAHASDTLVEKGDQVAQGDLLGYVGKTGSVTSPQLHFGIREGKKPVDPETLLPRRLASVR